MDSIKPDKISTLFQAHIAANFEYFYSKIFNTIYTDGFSHSKPIIFQTFHRNVHANL
jgi:hypothetical protein